MFLSFHVHVLHFTLSSYSLLMKIRSFSLSPIYSSEISFSFLDEYFSTLTSQAIRLFLCKQYKFYSFSFSLSLNIYVEKSLPVFL